MIPQYNTLVTDQLPEPDSDSRSVMSKSGSTVLIGLLSLLTLFVLLNQLLVAPTIGEPVWVVAFTIGYPLSFALLSACQQRQDTNTSHAIHGRRTLIEVLALYLLVLAPPLIGSRVMSPLNTDQLYLVSYLGFSLIHVPLLATYCIPLLETATQSDFWTQRRIRKLAFAGSSLLFVGNTAVALPPQSIVVWLTLIGVTLLTTLPYWYQPFQLLSRPAGTPAERSHVQPADCNEATDTRGTGRIMIAWTTAVTLSSITIVLLGFMALVLVAPNTWPVTDATSLLLSSTEQSAQSPPPAAATQTAPVHNVLKLAVAAVGAIGGLAVSSALVAIYWSQNTILGEQTEIQQKQSKIMKQSHVPYITSHERGVQLHAAKPTGFDKESGDVTLSSEGVSHASVVVENHSSEVADQVQLACLLDYPDSVTLDQPRKSGVCDLEVAETATETPRGQGALVTNEQGVTLLTGTPQFTQQFADGKESFCRFLPTIRQILTQNTVTQGSEVPNGAEKGDESGVTEATDGGLSTAGHRFVRFGFVLIYSNAVDERFKWPLAGAYSVSVDAFQPGDDITLDELKAESEAHDIEQLIDQVDWEVPEDAFISRTN